VNNIDQIEQTRQLWEKLLISNQLNVCSEALKGCSVMDVNILRIAYTKPEITPKEIIRLLNIPNSTLTNAVNRLSKKGLLVRKLNADDLRSLQISLTDVGKEAIHEHQLGEREVIQNLFSVLTENEIDSLLSIMTKIGHKIEND
jgi:Transcriptional regulators